MRRSQRLIAACVLIALSGALAGCGAGGLSSFDPTDMLDWLDTKKKLPGERKPVFPEGVPGVEQGVPKNMYKGASQQQQIDQPIAAAPPPPPPKSKQAKSKATPAAAPDAAQNPDPSTQEGAPADVPQDPKPKKMARKRTTTPPPDQPADQQAAPAQPAQQSAAPFPAPVPGGTFTR